jgi:hypothetical protein
MLISASLKIAPKSWRQIGIRILIYIFLLFVFQCILPLTFLEEFLKTASMNLKFVDNTQKWSIFKALWLK